jgi:NlpC/P60 family putative phage cell wall peptidase
MALTPRRPPAYSRDWAEGAGRETLLEAARRHLIEIPKSDARPGDVLVFRYRARSLAKHAGVMAHPRSMIHAMEGAPVCEVALSPWWRRHLAAAFAFPEIAPLPSFTGRRGSWTLYRAHASRSGEVAASNSGEGR